MDADDHFKKVEDDHGHSHEHHDHDHHEEEKKLTKLE